jgi:hypothetical protein
MNVLYEDHFACPSMNTPFAPPTCRREMFALSGPPNCLPLTYTSSCEASFFLSGRIGHLISCQPAFWLLSGE